MAKNEQLPDEEDIMVTLSLDNGQDVECRIITIFEAEGRDYIALLPLDENGAQNTDGEVYLYRYLEDAEGNPALENIVSDEEQEAAADRFDEWLDEAYYEEMKD